jgi:hypothetical protein
VSFVAEKVETTDQLAEFESFQLKDPFRHLPLRPSRWAVDRVRGWYFVNLGGGASEMPWFLRLFSRAGLVVNIHGRYRAVGEMKPKSVEVWWHLESIEIPKQHASRTDDLLQLIVEALQAYGHLGRSELAKAVHVNVIAPRFI